MFSWAPEPSPRWTCTLPYKIQFQQEPGEKSLARTLYPQYLIRVLILYHPPGDVWSHWPSKVKILLGQFSQNPPYHWCFLLDVCPLTSTPLLSCKFPVAYAVLGAESNFFPPLQNLSFPIPLALIPSKVFPTVFYQVSLDILSSILLLSLSQLIMSINYAS